MISEMKYPLAAPLETRNEFWRRTYTERRYMRHLTQQELDRRFRDLLLNILRIMTKDGKIGVAPVTSDGPIWWEKFTHVLQEMQLRYGPYPNGFRREMHTSAQEPFPDFASELSKKAAMRMASLNLRRGDVFIKFGKRERMEALYEAGRLRIQPATAFLDSAHNLAVRDDELSIAISGVLSPAEIKAIVVNPQDVKPNTKDQCFEIRVSIGTDYWIYCLTNSVEPRLFVDFCADTCVIIRDRAAFGRLLSAVDVPEIRQSHARQGNAIYVDPLLPPKGIAPNMFVPLMKHFAYTYQDEYRFCWVPHTPSKELAPIDVELGSLKNIAELITL